MTLLLVGVTPAHAEGNFTSKLVQVQPEFNSRIWTDRANDSSNTVVVLTNCKVNKSGAAPGTTPLGQVRVTLVKATSSTHGTVVATKKQACGVCNFGVQPKGDYVFQIYSINENYVKNRQTFLNADVKVYY